MRFTGQYTTLLELITAIRIIRQLYTPHSPVHAKTEAVIRAISPTTSTHPLPPTSPSDNKRRYHADMSQEMNMEDLVKLSVKEIIELASGSNPPSLLASRNAETVKEVEQFLQGIKHLKLTQQYVIPSIVIELTCRNGIRESTDDGCGPTEQEAENR